MFDFVNKHKTLIQIVLAIIFLPFAFFGVDSYFRGAGVGQAVAKVGDYSISQEEFSRALRERQEALQRVAQGRVDPALLDNPELRYATLDGLIQRRLLLDSALRAGVTVSDERLKDIIGKQQVFLDETGQFSLARYEQYLRSEGMTTATFEARLRQDIILRHFADGYADTTFVPRAVVEQLARLSGQQRELSHYVLSPEKFLKQVKLDADAGKQYYDANPAEFRTPEQVRVEYLVLSVEILQQQAQPDPAEVKKYYETNRSQFEVKESRQAAHIFVSADAASGAEARQKARVRAEEIHQQLTKAPAGFAELAKKRSEDPGSAANGGDLGFIGRGSMKDVPEFEAALYQLKPGEISAPVETRLGYHIIRLTAVRPAQSKGLDEVRGQIEQELRKQLAGRRFAELADGFNNVVYEQSESLKPAAELIKTAPQVSGWITRLGAAEPLLNYPRLLAAVFSDEVLRNKRNTEAIEVAPGTLVAARVVEHKPESVQPFEEARAALEKRIALRAAGRLAVEEGRRLLGELTQGKSVQIAWSAPQIASRAEFRNIPEPVVRQAFRLDTSKLPAYAGVENPQVEYTLVRVSRVQEAGDLPPEKAGEISGALRRVLAQEVMAAYVAALKQKSGVTINKEFLEKKER
ncbi:MAG TPA: SurA N-terminal domain-containing protein [Burkholderiales bacterium]|nr:SurA N-terminal domain-containing protein [Burkholderiales bacterium]